MAQNLILNFEPFFYEKSNLCKISDFMQRLRDRQIGAKAHFLPPEQ